MLKTISYLLFLILILISCNNYKAMDPIYNFSDEEKKTIIPEDVDPSFILKADASETKIRSAMYDYFNKYGYYILFLEDTAENINKNGTITKINTTIKLQNFKDLVYVDLSRTTMKEIPAKGFQDNQKLVEIKLPNTLETINNEAFSGCHMLKNIIFPASLTTIGNSAFKSCSSLRILDLSYTKITAINNESFNNCVNLYLIVLNDILQTIGDSAFKDCISLKQISLPKSLTSAGNYSLSGCYSLENIEYLGNNAAVTGNPFQPDSSGQGSTPQNLYLPNASQDTSWETFLGYSWNKDKIFYGQNMPK